VQIKYFFTKNLKNYSEESNFYKKIQTFFMKVKSPETLDFTGFAPFF